MFAIFFNKYFKYILISGAICLTIVACVNFSQSEKLVSESGKLSQSSQSSQVGVPAQKTVLEIWWDKGFNSEEDEALQQLINNWEQQSGYQIKLSFYGTDELFKKVERQLQSGDLPDLIAMFKGEKSLTARLAWEGKLADVSTVIKPIENLYTKDVLKTANLYNDVEKKRSYYALPIHQATMHVYYWRDFLEQIGYSDSDIPKDWDNFWKFWQKAQDELEIKQKTKIYGMGLPLSIEAGDTYQTFEQILEAYNIPILDAQGKLSVDRPEVRQGIIQVLDWYKESYQGGYFPPEALQWLNPDNNRSFLNRDVLMTTNDTLSIPAAVRQDPDTYKKKLGILELPNKPNGEPMRYLVTIQQVILLADSKHQEAAKDFLTYLIKPEINGNFLKVAGGRHSPVLKSVWQDSFWKDRKDPHIFTATHTFTKQPQRIYYTYLNPAYSIVLKENVWGQALKKVLVNNTSSEQAADSAIAQIKQIFAQW
ncbi:carbohydrate ABC transporter substrate-binding protein, CUT1 family [Stanieria cyanosphaera PCC 7437]|uniref:Carbohydrate ABC transporter substrate-binding protein, CUT1 family n=1 Tax=Stanieria cyanosphaera (strain ATCC 29371 / PCC 7437) TaxID=111780 RepID=K9XSL6_STAC7|nr:ABC transporter substrate-binding protein [Stanieria cyanosphaera]AFZ35590.1 carbohydrate ABC transporter substrate-binding protein, CUT1 family [Stanieria cyanosphaera PCC 7437]